MATPLTWDNGDMRPSEKPEDSEQDFAGGSDGREVWPVGIETSGRG